MHRISAIIKALTTERLFIVILFLSLFAAIQPYNPDVYLHLTTGRYIVDNGTLPHGDIFSFTKQGEPWILHEWLFQVLIYNLEQSFGPTGLQLFVSATLTAMLYITKRNGELAGAGSASAWASTMLLFLTWLPFISARPHIVTYLFVSVSLHALLLFRHAGRVKPLYIIPALMLPWVNTHGGFILGIIFLGYAIPISVFDQYMNERKWAIPHHLLVVFLLSIIVSSVNPNGLQQLLFPFQLMDQWVINSISEWLPPDFTSWNYAVFLIAVVAFLIDTAAIPSPQRRFSILLTLPFIIAATQAVRHLPIAALIIAPYLSTTISRLVINHANLPKRQLAKTDGTTNILHNDLGIVENFLNFFILSIFCIGFYFSRPAANEIKHNRYSAAFPVEATKFLINNNFSGRMFTTVEYSDYILYHRYPYQKVFFDVRTELYGKELSIDYIKMISARGNWLELFKKHKIDYVVLRNEEISYDSYIKSGYFIKVYEDTNNSVLLFTEDKTNAKQPRQHVPTKSYTL